MPEAKMLAKLLALTIVVCALVVMTYVMENNHLKRQLHALEVQEPECDCKTCEEIEIAGLVCDHDLIECHDATRYLNNELLNCSSYCPAYEYDWEGNGHGQD